MVIVAFENFEKIYNNYPVLHTCEEAPISRKLLEDTVYSVRNSKIQNFEKISKVRCESHKNYLIPTSSKGSRPKLQGFEENSKELQDKINNNLYFKNFTPINSMKER